MRWTMHACVKSFGQDMYARKFVAHALHSVRRAFMMPEEVVGSLSEQDVVLLSVSVVVLYVGAGLALGDEAEAQGAPGVGPNHTTALAVRGPRTAGHRPVTP